MTFKERIIESLKRLFSSGKFITAMAGAIVYVAAKRGIVLSPEDAQGILAIFGVLVGAQGLNDLGKGAKQVEAANPKPQEPTQVNIQNVAASEPDTKPLPKVK